MIDSPDALKELLPDVSRETIEKLAEFREMILAEDQNLISKNDKNFIWIRHFYDSLRLAQFITSNGNDIIDIGSGAGLPGIPVSVMFGLKNKVFLCENRPKRVSFLNKCIVNLDLQNTEVIPIKAEKIENKKFDIILARAVSQLNHLLSISYNICKKNTTLLLHKGVHIDKEIVQATKCWDFTHVLHENEREKGSFILELKNLIKSIT